MKSRYFSILFVLAILFSAWLTIYGQTVEVMTKNAEDQIEKKDYDAALKILDGALAREPRNANVIVRRAQVLLLQERFKEAQTEAGIALDINPKLAQAYTIRARSKMGIGEFSSLGELSLPEESEVIADLTRAVELEPNNYNSYVNRSEGYFKVRKIEESEADLTKAIELSPASADLYCRRGIVRIRRGFAYPEKYDQADDDFAKAISLAPSESDYYARRAVSRWKKLAKDKFYPEIKENDPLLKQIREDLKTALKLNPQNWLALAYRGETNYKVNLSNDKNTTENRAKVIDDLLASLKINPRDNEARRFLGDVSTLEYPADKLAATLEGVLETEKAYFEKHILSIIDTDGLMTFTYFEKSPAYKDKPQFNKYEYLKGLANAHPDNLCYQMHYRDFSYFAEALSKPFNEKYINCAVEMAVRIAKSYKLKLYNSTTPAEAESNYSSAGKWIEKANEIYPGSAASLAREVEKYKTDRDDYFAKNYKPPTPAQTVSSNVSAGNNPEENALIAQYNNLISANIPRLESQQQYIEKRAGEYARIDVAGRIFMRSKLYNEITNVINSHEAFITSLENLRERAYGKSPAVVSQINAQISSVQSAVSKLIKVRSQLSELL